MTKRVVVQNDRIAQLAIQNYVEQHQGEHWTGEAIPIGQPPRAMGNIPAWATPIVAKQLLQGRAPGYNGTLRLT